jgi:hypothetical protein
MNTDQDKEILIRYITGSIDPKLIKSVNERLESDVKFKGLYIELVTLSEGIRLNTLREKKKILYELENKLSQSDKQKGSVRFLLFGKILLAASLIGIVLIITFEYNKNPNKNESIANNNLDKKADNSKYEPIVEIDNSNPDSSIFKLNKSSKNEINFILNTLKMYVKPELVATILRSDESEVTNARYESALNKYRNNNFSEALKILNTVETSEEKYLKAHLYFNLKKYSLAENIFFELSKDEYASEQMDAEWFLLLSYSAQFPEKENKAKNLANKISKNQDSKYQFKALEILKALNLFD